MKKHLLLSIPFILAACGQVAAHSAPVMAAPTSTHIQASYGNIPLQFEANQGQSDKQVKFLSRGSGYSLFLTPGEAVLALSKVSPKDHADKGNGRGKNTVTGDAVRMSLVGANPNPRVSGQDELPGKVNYFQGNDPKKWRTDIATYKKVRYSSVYKGIDLVYYGNQKQLEYDFVVAPGADPGAIRFSFSGQAQIRKNKNGELVLGLSGGDIRWKRPVVYQEIGGVRKPVNGEYVLRGKGRVGFQVASYDRKKPLVIDPVLVYSTYLGGSGYDTARAIAVNSAGEAYITGETHSPEFPAKNSLEPYQFQEDLFITKISADGTALIYSSFFGYGALPHGIAVDGNGNAYITGFTGNFYFPVVHAYQSTVNTNGDAFIVKLNSTGDTVIYSTYFGGSGADTGYGIAADSSGNAYIIGQTTSADLPLQNAFQTVNHGSTSGSEGSGDAFVSKFSADGSTLVYSSYFGGSDSERGLGIAVDSTGSAYLAGFTFSTDLPTQNPYQSANHGGIDMFAAKLNPAGTALTYSTYLGGSGIDYGAGMAVDSVGCVYVTGWTTSPNFPLKNPLQSNAGGIAAFVTKFNADGASLAYSTLLGGTVDDRGSGITVDSGGNAYVACLSASPDFPVVDPIQATMAGDHDVTISKLNATGSALIYSTYFGGSSYDEADGIAIDGSGGAYVAGNTLSTDFPLLKPIQSTNMGGLDVFVAKIGAPTAPSVPVGLTATAGDAQVTLAWSAVASAASYNVKRATVSGGPYASVGSPASINFTNTGLSNGITYYYVVSAVNGGGESANSAQASATPQAQTAAPSAPAGLTAVTDDMRVTLSWAASSGATSYNVKRSTHDGGPFTTVTNTAALSFTNTGLINHGIYYFVVSALNGGGESANSAQEVVIPRLAAPQGLTATRGDGQVSLTWNAVSGATSYNLKRSTINGSSFVTISSQAITSYTDTGLTNGVTYYYAVTAVNGGGESSIWLQVAVTPYPVGPTAAVTTLLTFDPANTGYYSSASLLEGLDGKFYGVTEGGGLYDAGTEFRITSAGSFAPIHNFADIITDAAAPGGALIQTADGTLYGVARQGGNGHLGCIYTSTISGTTAPLHLFHGADGTNPRNGLIQASDGNFYGTVETAFPGPAGYGQIYKITPDGTFTTLYSLTASDSPGPDGRLVQGTDGNFYGTTSGRDGNGGAVDHGSIFQVTPAGVYTILHTFSGSDGAHPIRGLVQGTDGNFYGTTGYGGILYTSEFGGYGVAFKITPAGVFTVLHYFGTDTNEATSPYGDLIQATDGNFYGTTVYGGVSNIGALFCMTPSGSVTTLHSFGGSEGAHPWAGVIEGSDGYLYGTTSDQSAYNGGTIFKAAISPALPALASIAVSPASPSVTLGATQQFTAVAKDSAGNPLSPQPNFVWSVSGGGTILPSGRFTASGLGAFTVTVAHGPINGSAPVTVTPVIPPTPAGLTATAGDAQISLNWTAAGGATSYNVKRATVTGGPFATVSSPTATSYNDIGLMNGTAYYYVVSAVNGGGESGNSAQTGATPLSHFSDFNGDGKPDLVLQNTATRQVAIWYMNGWSLTGGTYISLVPASGWKVAAQGDFNGDGKPDLVLQNAALGKAAIWYLNGAAFVSGQYLSINVPAGWTIAGAADFNGDGKPDLVLQNGTTNKAAFWYMNGATVTGSAYTSIAPPTGYRVAGAGDFNGDGKPDLVLQNTSLHTIALWYMNGASVTGGAYTSLNPPSGWSVASVADFNGDGKPDLVLQDSATNKVAFWYMNGATVTGGAYASVTPPAAWKVVGPR